MTPVIESLSERVLEIETNVHRSHPRESKRA